MRFGLLFSFLIGLILILPLILPQSCEAKVSLAGPFSDHMVLQRQAPIAVWGTASPGSVVGVRLGDKKAVSYPGADGKWQTLLDAMEAGGPYELTVVSDNKIVLKDVMVGEVWLASGQSNMVLTNNDIGYKVDGAFSGSIRFISLPPVTSSVPETRIEAGWQILDKNSQGACSAIAAAFALDLQKELSVPVGIIVSAVGGSRVQSWVSRSGLETFPDGKSVAEKLDSTVSGLKRLKMPFRRLAVVTTVEEIDIRKDPARQLFLSGATLYNAMIAPLVPYSLKGVLWYQGEANVYEAQTYGRFFSTFINDWRLSWKRPDLPFVFVQLPPYGPKQALPEQASPVAQLRDAQATVCLVPYSFMAVTTDCCHQAEPDWHASNKQQIGKRLARIALASQYNKPLKFKSPSLSSYKKEGKKVRLSFKNVATVLKTSGDTVEGFAIAGDDKKPVWAKAALDGKSVVVWSDKVENPTQVSYGWADNPRGNLVGDDGLPVRPFKTDVKRN